MRLGSEPEAFALLRLLQMDGRRSYAQLARDTGMTQNAVRRRVREFVDSGLIEITAVLNPHALGYGTVAIIAVKLDAVVRRRELAESLAKLDAVSYIFSTTGRFQLFVEVFCRSKDDLLTTTEAIGAELGPGNTLEIVPYLGVYHQQADFSTAHSGDASRVTSISGEEVQLGETDREIIHALYEDGRVAFQEIGRRLGISEAQVRQRYTRMLDARALRVMALLNPMRLGFETVVMLGITTDGGTDAREIAEGLAEAAGVTYVALCAGRYAILAELVCRNEVELGDAVNERIHSIDGVRSVEAFVYLDLHHWRIRPPV
jgi:DNA-binding Lrp family transcriptional regulator